MVGFGLNLIALGLFTIFPIPSPVSFTIASLNAEYSGIATMANSQRKQQHTEESKKTESEAGHFMDSKKNKLYYFIQLEPLRLKNLTNILEKSNLQGIKDYFQRT